MSSEVGKGKPPKEHRFRPGEDATRRGGRPKGSVGLLRRLRRKLLEAVPGDPERTLADALVTKIVTQALRDPVRSWPILREIVDREAEEEEGGGEGEEKGDPGAEDRGV